MYTHCAKSPRPTKHAKYIIIENYVRASLEKEDKEVFAALPSSAVHENMGELFVLF